MKKIILFTVLLFSSLTFSQKISILDEETRSPIPYAKLILKDKDCYKNTEENGQAQLENTEEISEIQSFGYENLKVEKYQTVYLLKPKFTEIEEVEISKPSFSKSFKIGKIEKSNSTFGTHTKTWMVAREFTFIGKKTEKIFVKKIKFLSRINNKNSATIRINIFENENGLPGELIKSDVIFCKNGKRITEYELKNPLSFTSKGLIIGFEWIINKENEFETTMKFEDGTSKKITGINPSIGANEKENEKNTIIGSLVEGNWKFKKFGNNISTKNTTLAVELELTN